MSEGPQEKWAHEQCVRRTILAAFREAAGKLWGRDGLVEIGANMSADCRADVLEPLVLKHTWYPERYTMEWYDAAWAGPGARRREAFLQLIDRMMDAGFGRVRKVLVGLASPHTVIAKAAELWRHDHTHGSLVVDRFDRADRAAGATLTDHVYVETPLSRLAIAEVFRYAVSLAARGRVEQTHFMSEGSLRVRLTWG